MNALIILILLLLIAGGSATPPAPGPTPVPEPDPGQGHCSRDRTFAMAYAKQELKDKYPGVSFAQIPLFPYKWLYISQFSQCYGYDDW